jgi:hypothetical protein
VRREQPVVVEKRIRGRRGQAKAERRIVERIKVREK